jgi:hypothetical protein
MMGGNSRVRAPLAAPIVEELLEDPAGGVPRLLPVSALQDDLTVKVVQWPLSQPAPERPEHLWLYWDGDEVDHKTWNAPIPEPELFGTVPKERLMHHGMHTLTYRVQLYNSELVDSLELEVEVDIQAPLLGVDQGRLIFDEQVEREGVTARYLELNDNQVKAEVPSYDYAGARDTLIWYWNREPFVNEKAGERVLEPADQVAPIVLAYNGDMIVDREDGKRYACYEIVDYAGNSSGISKPVELEVKAKPVPRSFTWPLVPKATGTAETVRLALDGIGAPLLVQVPDAAVIYPDESTSAHWGEPGTFGYHHAPLEYQGQSRRYEIPLAKVVAHAGKIVEVRYRVVAKEGELPSALRKVNVQAPPISAYRSPYVQGAGVSGTQVYLSRVGTWTDVLMDPWYLMFPEQKVTIEVSGVLSGSGEVKETLLDRYEVKASDLTEGIKTRLGKAFLQRLVVPSSFTITSKLSFDGGESWRMTRSINLSLFS